MTRWTRSVPVLLAGLAGCAADEVIELGRPDTALAVVQVEVLEGEARLAREGRPAGSRFRLAVLERFEDAPGAWRLVELGRAEGCEAEARSRGAEVVGSAGSLGAPGLPEGWPLGAPQVHEGERLDLRSAFSAMDELQVRPAGPGGRVRLRYTVEARCPAAVRQVDREVRRMRSQGMISLPATVALEWIEVAAPCLAGAPRRLEALAPGPAGRGR